MYFFHWQSHAIFRQTYVLNICTEAILTTTQNVWFIKKNVQKYPLFMLRRVPIKFLYNSKFDFTAKPLVTNTVFITRVLCSLIKNATCNDMFSIIIIPDIWRQPELGKPHIWTKCTQSTWAQEDCFIITYNIDYQFAKIQKFVYLF